MNAQQALGGGAVILTSPAFPMCPQSPCNQNSRGRGKEDIMKNTTWMTLNSSGEKRGGTGTIVGLR